MGEKEERYPDDLEQPTTKPSSLDGDADTQNDAKKNREQEGRIAALTKEGDDMREQLSENETHLKEFREQVAALQCALEKREEEVNSLKSKLYDTNHENKILLEEREEQKKSALSGGGDPVGSTTSDNNGALVEAN